MDCAHDAAEIEAAARTVAGVQAVRVSVASEIMTARVADADARAVCRSSRNDAIGNLAVVVAAGLVAWTNTAWPDLLVAVIIAGLFLQSAWAIVRDARGDTRGTPGDA